LATDPKTLQEGTQQEILVSTGGVLYDAVAIAAAGETVEFVMPTSFHTCLIEITCQGDDDTDPATHAEEIRNVEAIEIFTTEGEALRVEGGNGEDPFNYSWWVAKSRLGSYRVGGALADEESVINYKVPLSFGIWRWFNYAGQFAGLPLELADRLRVTFGSDTNTGMNSRQATVQAFGLRKPKPFAFRTAIVDSYTAVIGQSHWSELPTDTRLAGVWTHHHTSFDCDTANTVLTVNEQRLAYGRTSFFKRVKTIALQDWIRATAIAADPDPLQVPADYYTYWPLDPCEEGAGEPNPGNLVVESVGGVAEATRVYPVVWRLV